MLDVIAFDADDTLWHNENLFFNAQTEFKQLLSEYHRPEWIDQKLFATEMRNLEYFGYGIKGFTLSMIETAIELTEGRIRGREIQQVIDLAKAMMRADVQLLDHARETVARLAQSYRLMLITKGDLFDQERKIARSALAPYFTFVEILSDKTQDTYRALLARHHLEPARFLMVGDSLRSDILPVLALGGRAVHIPYQLTWAHEATRHPESDTAGYFQLEHLGELPELVERLNNAGPSLQ